MTDASPRRQCISCWSIYTKKGAERSILRDHLTSAAWHFSISFTPQRALSRPWLSKASGAFGDSPLLNHSFWAEFFFFFRDRIHTYSLRSPNIWPHPRIILSLALTISGLSDTTPLSLWRERGGGEGGGEGGWCAAPPGRVNFDF